MKQHMNSILMLLLAEVLTSLNTLWLWLLKKEAYNSSE